MLVLRSVKGSPLTVQELDNNFIEIANRIDLSTDQTITGLKTFETAPIVLGNITPGSNQLSTFNYMKSLKSKYIFSDEYPTDILSNPDNLDRWFILKNNKINRILDFQNGSWLELINPDKLVSMAASSFILKNNKLYGMGSDVDEIGFLGGNAVLSKFTLLAENVLDVFCHKKGYFVVIKKLDGTYWAMGENSGVNYNEGGFGLGNTTDYNTFVQLPISNVNQIFVGCSNIFYTTGLDNQVYACGANYFHELGLPDTNYTTFNLVSGMDNVINIILEEDFSIFEKSDGTYYGTGTGLFRYLDVNVENVTNSFELLSFPGLSKPKNILVNNDIMIIVDSEDNIWTSAYAANTMIQLPTEFNNPKLVTQSKWGSFIVKQDNTVYVKGETSGELFTNSDDERFVDFTLNPNIYNLNKISGGSWHTVIEKSDGTLWVAGEFDITTHIPRMIS